MTWTEVSEYKDVYARTWEYNAGTGPRGLMVIGVRQSTEKQKARRDNLQNWVCSRGNIALQPPETSTNTQTIKERTSGTDQGKRRRGGYEQVLRACIISAGVGGVRVGDYVRLAEVDDLLKHEREHGAAEEPKREA